MSRGQGRQEKELNLRRNKLGMMAEEAKVRREKAEEAEEAGGKQGRQEGVEFET